MSRSTRISILQQLASDDIRNASAIFNCSGMPIDCASCDAPVFTFGGEGHNASISITNKQDIGNTLYKSQTLAILHPPVCAITAALACQELLRLLGEQPGKGRRFCIKIDGESMKAIYE